MRLYSVLFATWLIGQGCNSLCCGKTVFTCNFSSAPFILLFSPSFLSVCYYIHVLYFFIRSFLPPLGGGRRGAVQRPTAEIPPERPPGVLGQPFAHGPRLP